MGRKYKTILLSAFLLQFNVPIYADDAQANSFDGQDWLVQMQNLLPKAMCEEYIKDEQFGTILKNKNIDMAKCTDVITPITQKCIENIKAQVPQTINDQQSSEFAKKIGYCVGEAFGHFLMDPPTAEVPSTAPISNEPAPKS